MFPAASYARMVTWFDPTSSGIAADHFTVPVAGPEDPVLVDQATAVTPTLSDAVPKNVSVAALVETVLPPGDVIVRVGAVVSLPPGAGVGVGTGVGDGAGLGIGAELETCGAYMVRIAALSPAPSVLDIL